MKINELIKKIRLEHNYSFSEMGKRVGFSKGMISAVETERSPALWAFFSLQEILWRKRAKRLKKLKLFLLFF